jgi:hypothetical protein
MAAMLAVVGLHRQAHIAVGASRRLGGDLGRVRRAVHENGYVGAGEVHPDHLADIGELRAQLGVLYEIGEKPPEDAVELVGGLKRSHWLLPWAANGLVTAPANGSASVQVFDEPQSERFGGRARASAPSAIRIAAAA